MGFRPAVFTYIRLSLYISIFIFIAIYGSCLVLSPFLLVSQCLLFRYIFVSFLQHTFPTPAPFVSKCIVLPFPSKTHPIVLLCTILPSLNCSEIQQATLSLGSSTRAYFNNWVSRLKGIILINGWIRVYLQFSCGTHPTPRFTRCKESKAWNWWISSILNRHPEFVDLSSSDLHGVKFG